MLVGSLKRRRKELINWIDCCMSMLHDSNLNLRGIFKVKRIDDFAVIDLAAEHSRCRCYSSRYILPWEANTYQQYSTKIYFFTYKSVSTLMLCCIYHYHLAQKDCYAREFHLPLYSCINNCKLRVAHLSNNLLDSFDNQRCSVVEWYVGC